MRRHGYLHELGGHQSEASVLKALDDLTTQSSLDAIGLNSNEGTLHVYCWKAADTNEEEEEEACQNSHNKHVIRSVVSVCLSYECVP